MSDWYDIDQYEDDDDGTIKEYSITSSPNDFNIITLYNLIDSGIIKMPPFQRNYVWDIKRASKLIESIILGLPIPQIFLYEKGKDNFFVIDGQQRLLSIYFFVKQRFPTELGRQVLREYLVGENCINQSILSDDRYFSNFSLKLPTAVDTEKNKFDRTKYETLGDVKRTFDYLRTIRSVVIQQNEPDDEDSSMFEIFNRLNTGGQNLTSQEIRMSLFYSDFYKMLLAINESEGWRNLLGQDNTDLHFKDVEILVRSFAMLFLHENYKPSMTKFLNGFSKRGAAFDEEMNNYLKELFESFIISCKSLSQKDFLSASGKFNISFFESIFVAVCHPSFLNKRTVQGTVQRNSLLSLKNDPEFIKGTQDSIASKRSVDLRIRKAKEMIVLE